MRTNIDQKFSTPPPSWRKQRSLPLPMSERKRMPTPVKNNGDNFHVIHKVPAGDSPYVRAKHIQLIDKDPGRAVSLFWAAINAGDRIDSALKDMAVVMKQLDRSDEAIEAIKSFRHLCPYDSQESLDNVLIELYKRSGRIEEEVEMLQHKLKNIEEGLAFGGAKTKIARSQGKKIQITLEQERSRILGNLAWAYLQQNKYEIAEQYYRNALSLEVDRNKQCNLAICLMHMNRMTEAKSLLRAVRASAGNRQMDCSYAKSFERAAQMLTELEPASLLEMTEQEEDGDWETQRPPSALSANGNLDLQVTSSTGGGQNYLSTFSVSSSLAHGHDEETVLLNERDRAAYPNNYHENKNGFFGHGKGRSKCRSSASREASLFSPHSMFVDNWRKGSYLENASGISGFASTLKENSAASPGIGLSSSHQETYASPAAVRRNLEIPFTQPRSTSREFSNEGWRKERWGPIGSSNINISYEQTIHNDNAVILTQPRRSSSCGFNFKDQSRTKWGEKAVGSSVRKLTFEQAITTENVQQHVHAMQNVKEEVPVSTKDKVEIGSQNLGIALHALTSEERARRLWGEIDQVKDESVEQPPSQPAASGDWKSTCWTTDGFAQAKLAVIESDSQQILDGLQEMNTWGHGDDLKKLALEESNSGTTSFTKPAMVVDNATGGFKSSTGDETLHQSAAEKPKSNRDCSKAKDKKSWADMVEEEEVGEEEFLAERNLRDCLDDWNVEGGFDDENVNSNIVYPSPYPQNQIDYLSQKLEDSFDLKDGYLTSRNAALRSRNLRVRRSLCFDEQQKPESTSHFFSFPLPNKGLKFENHNSVPVKNKDDMPGKNLTMMSRNRLQVFRDITPFPDSP